MKHDDHDDSRELDEYVQDAFELLEQFATASLARRELRLRKHLAENSVEIGPGHPLWDEGIAERRRWQLVEFAHELVRAGLGRLTLHAIVLFINGLEFNRRFRDEYPEWYGISDKTLERNRAGCKPKIRVRRGRPREEN